MRGVLILMVLGACEPHRTGEVRWASRAPDGTIVELRSVVLLEGQRCRPVTGYIGIDGDEKVAEVACGRERDLVTIRGERDGYSITVEYNVSQRRWRNAWSEATGPEDGDQ